MAKEQLIIELIAETKGAIRNMKAYTDQAKKSADRVGKLTKLLKSYFAEITAGIMVARKFIKVVSDLTQAHARQETAEIKLNAALKATRRYSVETEQSLRNFAIEMQHATGIADDLTIAAAGIMTTFTQISTDTFPEALEAAANMSKMFGQELQQSVIQLGTALNDPIMGVGRLKRIGISFSEDQKKSIELFMEQNKVMEAQRVILDELNLEIGNVAKALGDTYAGKVDRMKSSFDDLKGSMGGVIAEGFDPMIEAITKLLENQEKMDKFINSLKMMSLVSATVASFTIEAWKTLAAYYDYLVGAMFLAGRAMAKAMDWRRWGTGEAKQAFKDLKDFTTESFSIMGKNWGDLFEETREKWSKLWKDMKGDAEEGAEEIVGGMKEIVIEGEKEIQILETLLGGWEEVESGVTKIIPILIKETKAYGKSILETKRDLELYEAQVQALIEAEEKQKQLEADIKQGMIGMADAIGTTGNAMVDMAKRGLKMLIRSLGEFLLGEAAAAIFYDWAKAIAAFVAGTAAIAYANTLQQGGQVQPLQVGGSAFGDRQPAMLERGEVVLSKETVQAQPAAVGAMRSGEGGGRMSGDVYLDGQKVGKWLSKAAKDGKFMLNKRVLV